MSALLWLDTAADDALDLRDPFAMYAAFAEMDHVAGMRDYPELFGVPEATDLQEDVDPDWLATVREQAAAFLSAHGAALGEHARWILAQFSESAHPPPPSHGPAA